MQKRILGRTGLSVSVIGFGGIPIQRVSDVEAVQVVEAGVEAGINCFDTARGYTDSEVKLGNALQGLRDRVILASKSMARTAPAMTADIEISLRNLSTEMIDIYQLHNVKDQAAVDQVMAPGGALEALRNAREAGKIHYIGVTGHRLDVLVQLVQTAVFDTVMFALNPVETGAEKLIQICQEQNIGMVVMKPLAGGAFHNSTAALKWVLRFPVSTVIPGMDTLDVVKANAAVGAYPDFGPDEEVLLSTEALEIGETFCRKCEYCQPCPEGLDIPTIFLVDGYYTRYGLQDWAVYRYNGMNKKYDACADCGLCETRCPYELPIRQKLREAHQRLGQE